jgi:hypothetical protein
VILGRLDLAFPDGEADLEGMLRGRGR